MSGAFDKPRLRSIPCLSTLSRSTLTKTCGTFGRNVGIKPAELGPFARGIDKCLHVLREKRDVFARAVLQHESESTGGADAGNRRRRESKSDSFTETARGT